MSIGVISSIFPCYFDYRIKNENAVVLINPLKNDKNSAQIPLKNDKITHKYPLKNDKNNGKIPLKNDKTAV
ncbi:MAG: hypothetical protein IJP62_13095 [Treponema sp.]|nr:hypothetical protein [Treponema sp.]